MQFISNSVLEEYHLHAGGAEYQEYHNQFDRTSLSSATIALCGKLLDEKTSVFLRPLLPALVLLSPAVFERVWMLITSRVESLRGGSGRTDKNIIGRLADLMLGCVDGARETTSKAFVCKRRMEELQLAMSSVRPSPQLLEKFLKDPLISETIATDLHPRIFLPLINTPWFLFNVQRPAPNSASDAKLQGAPFPDPDLVCEHRKLLGGEQLKLLIERGGVNNLPPKQLFMIAHIMTHLPRSKNFTQLAWIMPEVALSSMTLYNEICATLGKLFTDYGNTPYPNPRSKCAANVLRIVRTHVVDCGGLRLQEIVLTALKTPSVLVACMEDSLLANYALNNVSAVHLATSLASPNVVIKLVQNDSMLMVDAARAAYVVMRNTVVARHEAIPGPVKTASTLFHKIAWTKAEWTAQFNHSAEIFGWSLFDWTNFMLDLFGSRLANRTLVVHIFTFVLRGASGSPGCVIAARIASKQTVHVTAPEEPVSNAPFASSNSAGCIGTQRQTTSPPTFREAASEIKREYAEKQMLKNRRRFEQLATATMVRMWEAKDFTVTWCAKISDIEAKLHALVNNDLPASFGMLDGMRNIIYDARRRLEAAKQYASSRTSCTKSPKKEDATSEAERIQHVQILRVNCYRKLATAIDNNYTAPVPGPIRGKRAYAAVSASDEVRRGQGPYRTPDPKRQNTGAGEFECDL